MGWVKETILLADDTSHSDLVKFGALMGIFDGERDYKFQGPDDTWPTRMMGCSGRRGRSWLSFNLPVEPDRLIGI